MSKKTLLNHLRSIPDFPEKGISFKDVTSWFMHADDLEEIVNDLYEIYKDKGITKVCGIESRGFVVGAALAVKLHAGFIPIRKPGKLPWDTISQTYSKEYGTDTIEMHRDAIDPNDIVLIHDDLLATGGTLLASCIMVKKFNPKRIFVNCILELTNLNGKEILPSDVKYDSLLAIDEFE